MQSVNHTNHRTGDGSVSCVFFTANLKLFCSFSIKFITFYTKTENRPLSCRACHNGDQGLVLPFSPFAGEDRSALYCGGWERHP